MWRSGKSFASHARGLGSEPWPGEIMYFFSFFMWFRLWVTSFQNLSYKKTEPLSAFNQSVQTSGV